ncbi:hypothetical protein Solca_3279 [Solitalea canadensis DSM 3403]|uniref:Uncharacterized protein n=1 Tax=Solitalea canadensis (strain ATCC 29591 / DSM 3403 / JCM 21819 / LMG 8368 / NBRC 15130 / NCIMB 12057 / USAM 9D) TaxID=929556 RepID=H8KWW0_SOLCM|nr:hypothetical protein Solca_3279 [Solitalea canadensis DSM 3403]
MILRFCLNLNSTARSNLFKSQYFSIFGAEPVDYELLINELMPLG